MLLGCEFVDSCERTLSNLPRNVVYGTTTPVHPIRVPDRPLYGLLRGHIADFTFGVCFVLVDALQISDQVLGVLHGVAIP